MTRLRALFSKISTKMDLLLLGIMIVFALMVRRVDPIQDLAAHGDFIFVAVEDHGVRVLDAGGDWGTPVEVGMYNTLGSALGVSLRQADGNLELYVADGNKGVEMFDVSAEGELTHRWFYDENDSALDIAIQEDYAWVAYGDGGLWVLNVGDGKPGEKEAWQVAEVPSAVRVSFFEGKLYVLDQDWNLYKVDLNKNNPDKSTPSPAHPVSAAVNDFVVYGGLACLATQGEGLVLLNLNQPPDQSRVGQYNEISDLHSVAVYGSIAYVSAGEKGILALDFTRPGNIVPIGVLEEVQVGKVASIQPSEEGGKDEPIMRKINAQKVLLADDLLYYADSGWGLRVLEPRMKIEVQIVDVLGGINSKESWAQDVVVSQREPAADGEKKKIYAFMAGGDHDLWVFDVTQPEKPRDLPYKIKAQDDVQRLVGNTTAVALQGNLLYLAYRNHGVQVLDTSDPSQIEALPPVKIDGETRALALQGKKTLYAAGNKGLKTIDISDVHNARVIGSEGKISSKAEGLFVFKDHVLVASGEDGLQIVNVANPEIPTLLQTYPLDGQAHAAVAYAHYPKGEDKQKEAPAEWYAYVANGTRGLAILSLSNKMEATQLQPITFQDGREVRDVAIQGKRLFVTVDQDGLYLFDLSNKPGAPQQLDLVDTPGLAAGAFALGNYTYVADHNRGLRLIELRKDPLDLREVGHFDMPTRVKDLAITQDGQYAFIVGDANGLWSLSLADPKNPIPLNLLEINGEPNSIEFNGLEQVYLGDGPRGFYLVNLNLAGGQSPNPEVAAHFAGLKDVRRVKGSQGYAYVANGKDGVAVVSVEDLKKIKVESNFHTNGAALNLDLDDEYVYIVTSENKLDVGYIERTGDLNNQNPRTNLQTSLQDVKNITLAPERNQAYLADGDNGLVVVNVNQPLIADQPGNIPTRDTPGTLRDIAYTRFNLFLADGKSGVDMIYVPEWWTFKTRGEAYLHFDPNVKNSPQDCVPEALGIAAIQPIIEEKGKGSDRKFMLLHYAYVASDQCGLLTLEYTASMTLNPLGIYTTPGEVGIRRVAHDYGQIVVAMLKGIWKNWTTLIDVPYLGWRIVRGELAALDPRVQETALLFVFGVILLSFTVFLGLFLMSFFVLPVRDFPQAQQAYQRLASYFRGYHGAVARVREGHVTLRPLGDRGPGIALVDLNSAITIEEYAAKGSLFTKFRKKPRKQGSKAGKSRFQVRVAGPGLVFLKYNERIQGAVDLRRQVRRRKEVKALTRDGIEVVSNVLTIFTIGEDPEILKVTYTGDEIADNLRVVTLRDHWEPIPGNPNRSRQVKQVSRLDNSLDPDDRLEIHRFIQDAELGPKPITPRRKWPPYRIDHQRVFKAVVSRPRDVGEKAIKDWTELPAHVAAGIYRNLIHLDIYDNLYQPKEPKEYPIRDLKGSFGDLMRNQGILAFQYVKNTDGTPIREKQIWNPDQILFTQTRELRNPKLLRARGVKIIYAGFTALEASSEEVGEILTQFWQSEWQKEAMITRGDYQLQARRIINLARTETEIDLVNTLAMILENRSYTREALAFRILQTLEAAAADPQTRNLLPRDIIDILGHIQRLLLPGPSD